MATSSRREPDEFLIHGIPSKRCTEQGIEGDSTPSGLSLFGTSQDRGTGEPDQTVARPFAKLDRPLRGATVVRRDLSEGMVRESWFGIWVGRIGL